MVYFHTSISVCNSVDQPPTTIMANSVNSADLRPKPRTKKPQSPPSCPKFPVCDQSRSAAIDVVILIAVIGACGFLFFPYVRLMAIKLTELLSAIVFLAREEVFGNPLVYGSMFLTVACSLMVFWIVLMCTSRKCGKPNCKGLRKAAEFDIQLETEDCVKSANSVSKDCGINKRGLFELRLDHHRELEAELRKMAPPNGRAVLIFRARCGCSVGRLEVPGPRKQRKIKK